MQLIVIGMHRSGTSVLARLLNMMGVYFGPEGSSTGANAENPKGFWERTEVRSLNDQVLFAAGCDWNRVARFELAKVPAEALADFRNKARRLILDMDAHRPWLIKEPRLCLLMSLWRPLLEIPVCLHVVRDPREVALSLERRNQIPVGVGKALWARYVGDSLRDAQGMPMVHVRYEDMMANPVAEAARIHDALVDLGVGGLRMPSAAEILAFVDPALRHHNEAAASVEDEFGKLYADVASGRGFDPAVFSRASGLGIEALLDYEAGLPAFSPPELPGWDAVGIATRGLRSELAQARSRIQALEAEKAGLESERGLVRDRVARLESELLGANGQVMRTTSQLAVHASEVDALRKQLADARAELERVSMRAMDADVIREELALARSELDSLDAIRAGEVADLQGRLAEADSRLADTQVRLAEAQRGFKEESRKRQQVEASLALRFEEIGKLTRLIVKREKEAQETSGEYALATWRRAREARELTAERDMLQARLGSVLSSWSWRSMRPLRAMLRLVGLRRHAGDGGEGDLGRELALLRSSEMFDAAWYLEAYPDVSKSGMDAAVHYLQFGVAEGRDPGPGFSTRSYLSRNGDVANAGVNPLVHYMLHGKKEGRDPR